MPTWDSVCRIASHLPGAELESADGEPTAWRVNGRVLVRRRPRLEEEPDGEIIAIRTSLEERAALMAEDPQTYFLTPHWSGSRNTSILVRLASADETELRELITEAWRVRAKTTQLAEWSDGKRAAMPSGRSKKV